MTARKNLLRITSGLLLAVGPFFVAGTSLDAQDSRGKVTASPSSVDLGSVGHLVDKKVAFSITNGSGDPVSIKRVKVSCDCMKVSLTKEPLGPGQTREGTINVRFGRGFGQFKKHVDIYTSERSIPVVINVKATFHPGITLDSREFVLEGVVGKRPPESRGLVTIKRRGNVAAALQVTNVMVEDPARRSSHSYLFAEVQPVSDSEAQIVLSLAPEHPAGLIRGNVKAVLDGLPVVIPVRGTVYKGIRLKPDYLNFSRIDDVTTAEKRVLLSPVDERRFKITSITVTPNPRTPPSALVVTSEPTDAGGYEIIARLGSPAPAPGSRLSGHVVVQTDHPDCPEVRIRYMGFVPGPAKGSKGGRRTTGGRPK